MSTPKSGEFEQYYLSLGKQDNYSHEFQQFFFIDVDIWSCLFPPTIKQCLLQYQVYDFIVEISHHISYSNQEAKTGNDSSNVRMGLLADH